MNQKKYCMALLLAFAILIASGLAPFNASAAPPLLPPRPAEPLPPPDPPDPRDPTSANSAGAFIELRLQLGQTKSVWTVVQRQSLVDPGSWREVQGWSGEMDSITGATGRKTGFVDPSRFGFGPLRWLIFDTAGGKVIAESKTFYAPNVANQIVIVEMTLP